MSHNSARNKISTSGNESNTSVSKADQSFNNLKEHSDFLSKLNTQDSYCGTTISFQGHNQLSSYKDLSSSANLTAVSTPISSDIPQESDSKETNCIACFPPLGESLVMGNSGSSPCTCKVAKKSMQKEIGLINHSSRSNDVKPVGRKVRNTKKNRRLDESLSDVLQNLHISSSSSKTDNEIICVPRHVLYYAWFFDAEVSASLKAIADYYLTECLEVKQFDRFMQSNMRLHGLQDPLEFYRKPKRKSKDELKYHVTAKFCDRLECFPYQENVQNFIGKEFQVHIVGLFFSEKTFGMRVKLTASQKALFDERRRSVGVNVDCNNESASSSHSKMFDWESLAAVNESEIKENYFKDPKCKSNVHNAYPGISLVRQKEDFNPTDSRAHITIGCAPKVNAVQTGEDLLEILDLEMRQAVVHKDFQIPAATLRQFGRTADAFVIYPHHEIVANATFDVFI